MTGDSPLNGDQRGDSQGVIGRLLIGGLFHAADQIFDLAQVEGCVRCKGGARKGGGVGQRNLSFPAALFIQEAGEYLVRACQTIRLDACQGVAEFQVDLTSQLGK